MNKTYLYYYDAAGNRTGVRTYTYTTGVIDASNPNNVTFADSAWGDLLTNYNGNTYTYDAIGNLTRITTDTVLYNYEWQGRQLMAYNEAFDMGDRLEILDTTTFTYNDEGIRTSKTVNGTVHEYILSGSTVIAEKWSTSAVLEHMLIYVYDESGAPMAIQYRNTNYDEGDYDVFFLEKNLFGDVIAIYNEVGTKIGTYKYDAWGNFEFSTMNTTTSVESMMTEYYNPFRYRGYFYDEDTGLYYLQSRYYSPELGRFINSDSAEIISASPNALTDKNLFAYCDNNPIMRTDEDGEFWHVVIGAAVGATLGVVSALLSPEKDGWDVLVSGLVGAAGGALSASGLPTGLIVSGNALLSAGQSVYDDVKTNITNDPTKEDASIGRIIANATVSAGVSAVLSLAAGPSNGKAMSAKYDSYRQAKTMLRKGNHPQVKAVARKTVQKYHNTLKKYSIDTLTSGALDTVASDFSTFMFQNLY